MSDSTPGAAITFVESATFTQRVVSLDLEEALRRLQLGLAAVVRAIKQELAPSRR